jgi:tetratricopeptide (TPR) repeat protein
MTRPNLSLIRALLVIATTVVAVGCGTAESRKARFLERGQLYLSGGNLDKARVEFRNALQALPNDAEARYLNGIVQERLGNAREAAKYFQAAVDVRPDYPAARAELARIYTVAGVPDKALETLGPGLEKHPDDAMLLTMRAAARAQLKDRDGALADAEKAYRIDPKNQDADAVLAGLYTSIPELDKALAVLTQGVKDHPDGVDLRVALAQLYGARNDAANEEATLREVIKLKPGERVHRLRLAQFLALKGDDAAAESALREGVSVIPKDRDLQNALVRFLFVKRGAAAAEAELNKMIAASPDDHFASFTLAQLYAENGEPGKAEAIYQRIIAKEGTRAPALDARNRLAAAAAARGDTASAKKLVAEILDASPHDADALVLRGNMELASGDPKDAIVDLRAVLRDQPSAPGILRVLARAHLRNGEPALAEETLRRAMDANPGDVGVRLDLASFLAQDGKPEQAEAIVQALAKDRPADSDIQEALFRVSVGANDFATARAAADAILAANPKSAVGQYFLGLIAEHAGKVEEALADYQKALERQPAAAEPLEAIVRLLVAKKREGEALRRLDAQASRNPSDALAESLKGEVLLNAKRFADAGAAFREAIRRAPKWWVAYRNLAFVSLAQGDRAAGLAVLEDAIARVAEPNRVRAQIASTHEAAGEWDGAIRQYEAVLQSAPNDPAATNNLAMLLANHRGDPASVSRAAELVRPFATSPNPALLDTFGWVSLKHGDAKAALPALEKAQAAAPGLSELRYHLAVAEIAAGQTAKAAENLKQALASNRPFDGRDDAKAALAKLGGA